MLAEAGTTPASTGAAPLLEIDGLTVRFGGITALNDVSFSIAAGDVIGLIGPNGAGKTTCFNCITRLYHPTSGDIRFKGESLLRRPAHRIAEKRIVRTFQNVALFERMSALDNVLVGDDARRVPGGRSAALEILAYLGAAELAHQPVGQLPFGSRKTVELARALAADPELLLLDEPACGLNSSEVAALGEQIRAIARDFATTVLMVEHHMGLVMGISDNVVVLASGRKLTEGSPESVRNDPAVIEAYLGTC
jgi:branched-chain amino acid transport system ATP-binding protein